MISDEMVAAFWNAERVVSDFPALTLEQFQRLYSEDHWEMTRVALEAVAPMIRAAALEVAAGGSND